MLTTAIISDVLGEHSEIDVSIYDRSNECFLGHVRMCPLLSREQAVMDTWLPLQPRTQHESVTGEIRLQISFEKTNKKHYGPDDFEVLRLIGKGLLIYLSTFVGNFGGALNIDGMNV